CFVSTFRNDARIWSIAAPRYATSTAPVPVRFVRPARAAAPSAPDHRALDPASRRELDQRAVFLAPSLCLFSGAAASGGADFVRHRADGGAGSCDAAGTPHDAARDRGGKPRAGATARAGA